MEKCKFWDLSLLLKPCLQNTLVDLLEKPHWMEVGGVGEEVVGQGALGVGLRALGLAWEG